ncbi:MAG: hypothetical protein ACPGYF_05245 [Chitinophagales bacterium]
MKAPFTLALLFSSILLFAQSPSSPEDVEVKLEEIKKKEELKSLALNLAKEYAIHFSLLTNSVVKAQEEASYWKDVAENTHAFYAEYIDSIEESNAQLNAGITALARHVDQVRDSMENLQNEIILDLALGHEKSDIHVYDTAISAYEYGCIIPHRFSTIGNQELYYARNKHTQETQFYQANYVDCVNGLYPYPLVYEEGDLSIISFVCHGEACESAGTLKFFRLQNDEMQLLGDLGLGYSDLGSFSVHSQYSFLKKFDHGIPRLHCTTAEYTLMGGKLISTTESIYYFDGSKYSLLEE